LLRVLFDTRVYRDGQARIAVDVENVLDVNGATQVSYGVEVLINGQRAFSRTNVAHGWLSRWHRTFGVGLQASQIGDDFGPAVETGAVPKYLSIVADFVDTPTGPSFDILQPGGLHIPMTDHGGRDDIGPYPAWTARYISRKNPAQKTFMLAQADQGASWPIHIRESDGRLVTIDERPNFWLDNRADPDPLSHPRGNLGGSRMAEWEPDLAHQPSLAYVPYLVTGDRFYADEMTFWANFSLLRTWQDAYYSPRGGRLGLLAVNEPRGIGWGLRNIVDAASYLPDTDPYKAYFVDKVTNNLADLDNKAREWAAQFPLGFSFPFRRPEDDHLPPYTWIADWEHAYVAWAIDHANKQGWPTGGLLRDRIVQWIVKEFTSDAAGFDHRYGATYVGAVGRYTVTGNRQSIVWFTSMKEVFDASHGNPPKPNDSGYLRGYTGPDSRLALVIGAERGIAGAATALSYVWQALGIDMYVNGVSDLANRAQFAIEPYATTAPSLPPLPPNPPAPPAPAPDPGDPFGSFDTPAAGALVAGEVAMTGWALDDQGVAAVEIYRSPVSGEATRPNGLVFIGSAVQVTGARPDIRAAYTSMPQSDRAGWGLMLLSNMLPNQGNGIFTLYAYAADTGSNTTLLGRRTINVANSTSLQPFGTIDTPAQGATISGVYTSFGWALTPRPAVIARDGSAIDVMIDGVLVGHPVYNVYRADIASLFPTLNNAGGAVGHFTFDTRRYANGLHTMSWVVRDSRGAAQGVGSRYFVIQN
jgi:hypothetical protein